MDTQTPNVRLGRILSGVELGRSTQPVSNILGQVPASLVNTAQSEITNFEPSPLNEYVLGLNVSMDNVATVKLLETSQGVI